MEDALKRIIEDNRRARAETTKRINTLASAMSQDDPDVFHESVSSVLDGMLDDLDSDAVPEQEQEPEPEPEPETAAATEPVKATDVVTENTNAGDATDGSSKPKSPFEL